MLFDTVLFLLAVVLAVIPCRLLWRIDSNLTNANRNLEEIAAALKAKP